MRLISRSWNYLSAKLFGAITHVYTDKPIVALTFDDGPHPVYTPLILELLANYQAKATFFMVGEAAQRHQNIVKMVAEAGHGIGIHSWDHTSFLLLTGRERRRQILACSEALTPYGTKLFRPPWGELNFASCVDTLLLGYQIVTWNKTIEDWFEHEKRFFVDRLLEAIKPGNIILLHDTLYKSRLYEKKVMPDRVKVIEALDVVLSQKDDLAFVTVPALLQSGQPVRRKWYKDHNKLNG